VAEAERRLVGLPPVLSSNTRLLILGSFPGAASLAAQQYYAFARNHFWTILSDLRGADLRRLDYPLRLQALREWGVGLWDVYAACLREGSLDSAIRAAEFNDFEVVRRTCPQLRVIAHNGGESARGRRHTESFGVPVLRLPSTSPANASWSYARKLAAWREAFLSAGVPVAAAPPSA